MVMNNSRFEQATSKRKMVGHAKYVRELMRPGPCISYTSPESIAAKLAGQEAEGVASLIAADYQPAADTIARYERMMKPKVKVDHRVEASQNAAKKLTTELLKDLAETAAPASATYADAITAAIKELA